MWQNITHGEDGRDRKDNQRFYWIEQLEMVGAFTVLIVGIFSLCTVSFAKEYSFVKPIKGKFYVDDYFNQLKLPDVNVVTECAPKTDNCWYDIVNGEGEVIDGSYDIKTNTIIQEGKSRYKDRASAFIKRIYKVGREYHTEFFLINHLGYKIYFKGLPEDTIEVKPLINGNILVITRTALYEVSPKGIVLSLPLPRSVEYAYAGNNPYGYVSVIAAGDNDLLFANYMGRLTKFLLDRNTLTSHGDRLGILSIYPDNKDISYAVVYRYVNPYNKGIVFYKVNFANSSFIKGYLFNSEDRNVGFDPSVFSAKNSIIVSAKNSSKGSYLHFIIPKKRVAEIEGVVPEHIKGFESENYIELLISAKLSMLTWNAFSEVRKDDYTYAKVQYDLSNSIFYGTSLEGRVGDTQIAITYMQNKAESKGGLTAQTSRFISAVFDFHNLLGRNTLRIGYEQGNINGIAKFEDVQNSRIENILFKTRLSTYYGYIMQERGLYYGLEYLNYKVPSAVGFSDSSGNVVYYDFDRNFTLNSFLLVIGYDHVSYSKRYETNFNSFYLAGNGGLGLGMAKVSSALQEEAKRAAGASSAQIPLYIVLKSYGELGYLYQRRAKLLRGLGFSLNLGYRLTFMLAAAGNDGSNSNPDKVYLEFSRYEFLHGPFLQANIIF